MKKLIAISVVFALVAGAVFAVDLTGTVFGHVNVLEGTTAKNGDGDPTPATSSGGMDRVRVDGSGEAGDGEFGGYVRLQMDHKDYVEAPAPRWGGDDQMNGADFVLVDSAYAWWKPVDQFKLIIGNFSDGFWGKEGVTGWGFNQMPNDSSVAINYGIWCGPYWGSSIYNSNDDAYSAFYHNRYVFFEGFVRYGASLEITPADMIGINVGIPFIEKPRSGDGGSKADTAADVFKASVVQFDIKMDFGNIAITYDGSSRAGMKAEDGGAIFVYYGGSFGDLSIDFGFSYHLVAKNDDNGAWGSNDKALPFGIGVGAKYATDSFGVKFRTTAVLGGDKERGMGNAFTYINTSLLPFFNLGDNLTAFVGFGLGMTMLDSDTKDAKAYNGGENVTGWYFNPYLRVGAEWGPTFYFGIKAWSDGLKNSEDAKTTNWAVPVSLMVSF